MKVVVLKNEGQTNQTHDTEDMSSTVKSISTPHAWDDLAHLEAFGKTVLSIETQDGGNTSLEIPTGSGIFPDTEVKFEDDHLPFIQLVKQETDSSGGPAPYSKIKLPYSRVSKFEMLEDKIVLEVAHTIPPAMGNLTPGRTKIQRFEIPLPTGVPRVVRRTISGVGDLQIERYPATGIQIVRLRYTLSSSFAPTVIDFSSHPFADTGYVVSHTNAQVKDMTTTTVTISGGTSGPGSFILEGKY